MSFIIENNKPLAPMTWFKVGGSADYYYSPNSIEDLQNFLKSHSNEKITILGNLSNVLIRDAGIKGYVIRLSSLKNIIINNYILEVEAGCINRVMCLEACRAGKKGLEFLNSIPGTIGGAIKMNAGANGRETKDVLISCKVMDKTGNIKELTVEQLGMSYRKSDVSDDMLIISAKFKVEDASPEEIKATMDELLSQRDVTQPGKEKTGGSTFKNPEGYSAWKLIDEAGLRGYSIGGAKVSEKHTNFIINYDNASAKDIESLIHYIKEKVYANSGVVLESEIKIIGEE